MKYKADSLTTSICIYFHEESETFALMLQRWQPTLRPKRQTGADHTTIQAEDTTIVIIDMLYPGNLLYTYN